MQIHNDLCGLSFISDTSKRTNDGHIISEWLCVCGANVEKIKTRVINGYVSSCGCVGREKQKKSATTHGMRYTKEYKAWRSMRSRCFNKNDKDYKRYGAKGITVYEPWRRSFEEFFSHIGKCPSPELSIDRINTKKGYFPKNIRWSDSKTQARNRTVCFIWFIKGERFEAAQDAANHFNVSKVTIHRWVNGCFDKRRGTFTKKRNDCYATPRY